MKTLLLLSVVLLAGCAQFRTVQTDVRFDDEGKKITEIETRATAYTFFAGKSVLSNWQASQTEGEQGASVGSLSQETNAGTNIVQALNAILQIVEAVK